MADEKYSGLSIEQLRILEEHSWRRRAEYVRDKGVPILESNPLVHETERIREEIKRRGN